MFRSIITVKADLAQAEYRFTGRGIVWAVVCSGVDGRHLHFQAFRNLELPAGLHHLDYSRITERFEPSDVRQGAIDFLDRRFIVDRPVDLYGVGTGVAGIIAGQGTDDQGQVMKGIVPEAKILSVNVLDERGQGVEFNIIAALRAIQQINGGAEGLRVHGVVVPLATHWDVANYACGHSPICVEVDRLVNSGVVVVVPSGNVAFDSKEYVSRECGITDPGNSALAITVGATHRTSPQIYGASWFSSRGPTADGRLKPDLLAPGEKISVCEPSKAPPKQRGGGKARPRRTPAPAESGAGEGAYRSKDGTSFAAAYVAGAAAAVLSAQPGLMGKAHDVKALLLRTAVDLGRERTYQGAGLVDVLAATREAAGAGKAPGAARDPVKVFCSYSHLDEGLCAEFRSHLAPMERAGRIRVWYDQLIEPGQKWKDEILANLNSAEIVILLISSYFMASDFCYREEFERALEREAVGSARIVPIIVRPVTLLGTPLASIQVLPKGAEPITSFDDPHAGWAKVTERLYEIVVALGEVRKAGRRGKVPGSGP